MSCSKPLQPNKPAKKTKKELKQEEEAAAAAEKDATTEFRTRTWDLVADQSSPMQVDAMWEYELKKHVKSETFREHYRVIRFFLKVLYPVVMSAYNYGLARYKYVAFKMPATHIEQWRLQSPSAREKLFLELRFCHITGTGENSGTVDCENSFLVSCDMRTLDMIGGLDNKFVARHGMQVPRSEIKYRGASDEESLLYMTTRIDMDKKLLDVTDDSDENFKDGLLEMLSDAAFVKSEIEKRTQKSIPPAEATTAAATSATSASSATSDPASSDTKTTAREKLMPPDSASVFDTMAKQTLASMNKN